MFLTIRHFHDQNALRSYGQNGPLKPHQEELITTTTDKIATQLQAYVKTLLRLLTTTKTRRLSETTQLLREALQQKNIDVIVQHEPRLEVMDQGDLNLPDDYKDGDWFTPLDVARDAICDEAYRNQNLFYRFGDHLNGKYPTLAEAFSHTGESMGWSLKNKYSLIYDLAHGKLTNENEIVAVVAQSDLPLLLMELQALKGSNGITPKNLPYKCWEIYKSGLQDTMYDKTAIGNGNFDIPMGYVGIFEPSEFITSGLDKIIYNANLFLTIK